MPLKSFVIPAKAGIHFFLEITVILINHIYIFNNKVNYFTYVFTNGNDKMTFIARMLMKFRSEPNRVQIGILHDKP